jgi:hypothetical protein
MIGTSYNWNLTMPAVQVSKASGASDYASGASE